MARHSQTALFINDPVKIVAGVFTIRQFIYVAGIVGLTYGLITATSRLPYGQSGLGQLHLLLVVGVPAGLGLLVLTFAGSGTVEPYARQLSGYFGRTTLALPRRLAYRAARLARRGHPPRPTPAPMDGPARVAEGTTAGRVEGTASAPSAGPRVVPPVVPLTVPVAAGVTPLMATPLAQAQRARLLAWLAAHPGATNEEIAAGADLPPSAVRPRRRELEAAGLVRKRDEEGRTQAGRRAARWVVVGTGETGGTIGTPGEGCTRG